jgi:hypothetical protein
MIAVFGFQAVCRSDDRTLEALDAGAGERRRCRNTWVVRLQFGHWVALN